MLDPISEMITRIRNAQQAGKPEVLVSASKLKSSIAQILVKEGFIEAASGEKEGNFQRLRLVLKYYPISQTQKLPAIRQIRRISKEGKRMYVRKGEIKNVKNSFGIGIISTSKGLMTHAQAQKMGLGGEYICEIW